MAAAGPAGNLAIAAVAFACVKLGLAVGWFVAPDSVTFSSMVEFAGAGEPSFATSLLSVLLVMNVFLCAFNLLPLPPLDGAAVLNGLLPARHAHWLREMESNAMMSMVGLIVAWRVFPLALTPCFRPCFAFCTRSTRTPDVGTTIRDAIVQAESNLPGTAAPECEMDSRWQAVIAVAQFIDSEASLTRAVD